MFAHRRDLLADGGPAGFGLDALRNATMLGASPSVDLALFLIVEPDRPVRR
jgi:hypothetical protein